MSEPGKRDSPHVVIVGSGASGMLAALRLAETARVTLVEAGVDAGSPPPSWLLDDFEFGDRLDWGFRDADTGNPILRGRVTGGSTSINSAAALRGQPRDFDEWNVPGWSWADVEYDFAAIESDREFGHTPGHGWEGPIPVIRLPFGDVDERFAGWAAERGHPWVEDQNSPGALGVGPWPSTMTVEGQRWSAHAAILPLLRDRVTLLSSTEVLRVLFDRGTATGVLLAGPNGLEELPADHVVLSAGAYGSPALLMRSGIGDRAELDAAGVPVIRHLPAVGAGLQDHPWAVLQVRSTRPGAIGQRPLNGALLRYEVQGDGIDPSDGVEVHLYPHQALPYVPDAHPDDVFIGMGLMRAISRGSVSLASDGSPEIRLGHLGHPQDAAAFRAVLGDAILYLDRMIEEGLFIEPPEAWWRRNDLDVAIIENLDSYGHAVGTCRMGTDADAVVDERLVVRGLSGLSIVDASVMPASPRANTMLASMMVGWRGAGFVAARLAERRHPATSSTEGTL